MKRKSSLPPTIQCIFCDEKEMDFSKKSKKQQQFQKLHAAGEFHTSFQKPNVQHVNSLTAIWRNMACFLGDTNILSKLDSDLRGNEIFYHSKCQKKYVSRYNSAKNKSTTIKSDMCCERAIAVERTIDVIRQEAYEKPESPIAVRYALDVYNSFLSKEGVFVREYNITRFGELILHHTNHFEIHKNSHNVNVFILKNQYVKANAPTFSFDESMKFLRDARKVVIGLLSGWASTALQFYRDNDQVIPLKLRRGVFTVFTKDNIDQNSSSNQATNTFMAQVFVHFSP